MKQFILDDEGTIHPEKSPMAPDDTEGIAVESPPFARLKKQMSDTEALAESIRDAGAWRSLSEKWESVVNQLATWWAEDADPYEIVAAEDYCEPLDPWLLIQAALKKVEK
jgi:hypothetical protein